ncbi:MAG: NAD(P)H-dependent glycerol-3-phosphate dehydrogenase [Gemmatimonadota bacterium]
MTERPVTAAVLGAGSWGSVLAIHLHRLGHQVRLWSFEEAVVEEVRSLGENRSYLPDVPFPSGLGVSSKMSEVLHGAELVVSVSPSQFVGRVMSEATGHMEPDALVVSASKGIEIDTLRRMDEVIAPLLPPTSRDALSVLSGPSFAMEVARGTPTAVVAASTSRPSRLRVQRIFSSDRFRVYTNDDVVGVELGGSVKNVIALAAGVAAGLGYGHNTRAALITRGLAEITRLGEAMGAASSTFAGLAGMGDLVLTCTGELSRNRTVGKRLGEGESLEKILSEMKAVAEGVRTAPAVQALAERHGVEMPITAQVVAILEGRQAPEQAVHELMIRDPKAEN